MACWAEYTILPNKRTSLYRRIWPFHCVRAYALRRDSKGAMPLGTRTLAQSLVCYTLPEVYSPFGTHVRSDLPETHPIQPFPLGEPTTLCRPQGWKCHSGLLHFWRSAFSLPHEQGFQSKRQDATAMVIPCLCSFTVLRTLAAEPPINKKRTRTLFRKESGSSTNCMVEN